VPQIDKHVLTLSCSLQLNSISLSKNIMRSLQASKADMPPLDAFPKSQQVTFKYYAGVISFLEEDYVQVRPALSFHFPRSQSRQLRS